MKAHARASDPDTSHEAAASVRNISATHERILFLLRSSPRTDENLARTYAGARDWPRVSPSGLRSRRAELVALGRVEDSGRREPTASGRRQIVWQLTESPMLW